ncbi:MAG: manno-octulosonate cytidylyltransferase [Pseudomonadota bacterium]
MSVLLVIPARYASSRYPGKPLVPLRGADGASKTLLHRTWEAALAVAGIDRAVVATDDDRIAAEGRRIGAEIVMTSDTARNGTERCAEAHAALGNGFDIVVNLQGDAPLTPPWFIEALVRDLSAAPKDTALSTPVLRCDGATLAAFRTDRAAGRVGGTTAVFGSDRRALYFSKEVVPFTAATYAADAPTPVFHHVGVYAYAAAALAEYPGLAPGSLEGLEGLEQLRFLEHGRPILCTEVESRGRPFWELNNPDDVPRIEMMLSDLGIG